MDTKIAGPWEAGAQTQIQPIKVKYVVYARKSSEQDELQALSIESQVKEMLRIAEREGLDVVDVRREAHSAKDSGQRPVFAEILADLRRGRFNGILTWAADRLSRNAGDLGSLVDLMDQKVLIEIKTYGQKFSNSPSEKFLLMILCSQAKLENDNKSVNVKRGLRTRVEMGLWPGTAPTGYLNQKGEGKKCQVIIDPQRAPVIRQMFEKVAYENWSGRKLYLWLKLELNFKTKSNHHLSLSNLYLILQNPFYHGTIEYPARSGIVYEGKHKPIISKELFVRANDRLKRDKITRSETREFAFTKLMTCGKCGSGITAEEKYKKLKDGTTNRYVYYGCCRSRDRACKAQYMREEDLIEQLVGIMDELDIREVGMRNKFDEEVVRFNKFQKILLGAQGLKAEAKDIDLRTYAKYLLREGSTVEKRELLACVESKLVLKDKLICLEKVKGGK